MILKARTFNLVFPAGWSREQSELPMVVVGPHGEQVTVMEEDGSTLGGVAISVRMRDGTKVPALFHGPGKLAEVASGGDFEFHEDSLAARVRLLEPGQEMQRRGGNQQ